MLTPDLVSPPASALTIAQLPFAWPRTPGVSLQTFAGPDTSLHWWPNPVASFSGLATRRQQLISPAWRDLRRPVSFAKLSTRTAPWRGCPLYLSLRDTTV